MSPYNFFVCGPKFPYFFAHVEGVVVDKKTLQICDMLIHSGDIREQSRKVVGNRAKFWTFFALPNFRGPAFQKLYPFYYRCLAARRPEKVL